MTMIQRTPVRRRWSRTRGGHALTGVLWLFAGACGSEAADGGATSTDGQAGKAAATPAATPAAAATPTATASSSGAMTSAVKPSNPGTLVTVPGAQPAAAGQGTQPAAAGGGAGSVLPCAVSKSLASNCQNCHGAKPIGGAPMPLVTYADLMKPAVTAPEKKVYELVQTRIHDSSRPMPPNAKVSDADMSALDSWLQGGVPTGGESDAKCDVGTTSEGAGALKPGARGPRDFTTGRLTPTAEETCYEFKVHGSTTSVDDSKFNVPDGEQYEQFYYNIPWPAGQVATAYATVADNAAVLHHWLLFSTNEAQNEGNHITAPLPTLIGFDPILLAGWAVGGPNVVAPDDVGFELPEPGGRTMNVQWHFYNSTGSPQSDASTVQICTVPKQNRAQLANVTWAGTEDLNGNVWTGGAGMPPHKETTYTTTCLPGRKGIAADQNIHIIGFEPHMHRIGKHMSTSIKHMDGTVDMVFDQPFSFGSETHYPVDLDVKPGESLITSCTFNNDTDRGVPFGESSDSEMCYQFTWAYPAHAITNNAPSLLGVPDTCW